MTKDDLRRELKEQIDKMDEEQLKNLEKQIVDVPWNSSAQLKNIGWYLPRPKPDQYKGGMPLHCEKWLTDLAEKSLNVELNDEDILQPFAGGGKKGIRTDLKNETNADILADAHNLPFNDESFKFVLCDPPYSDEEADDLYNTPDLTYSDWAEEAYRVTESGGVLAMYHKQLVANPHPEDLSLVNQVFIANRTWHLMRVARFYKKS